MANINSSTRFGVVYGTPAQFAAQASTLVADPSNYGKLYVLTGETSGAITQGVYIIEPNSNDPDGYGTISMLSSGTYASSTNAGLMSATDMATLSAALSKTDASNTYLKINDASFFRTVAVKNGTTTTNIVADSSRDTLTINAGSNIKLTGNASNDTLTIEATDTVYTHPVAGAPTQSLGTAGGGTTVTPGTLTKIATVYDASFDASGHYTGKVAKDISINVAKPSTAGTADEAKKTTGTLTFKVNGIDASAFNGSVNTSLNFKDGNNIKVTEETDGVIKIDTSGVPTLSDMNTAIATALTSALKYKGTVKDGSVLPTSGNKTGDVYVASGAYTTTQNSVSYKCEAGDLFIFNGTYFDIVNGENQVDNKNATLSIGDSQTIATVDGTDIVVSLPSSGYYTHPGAGAATQSLGNATKNTTVTIGTETKIATVYDVSFDASGHYKGKVARDISINITSNNTDEKVKAATSAGKFYLIGQDDATSGTTETAYKNASVYVDGSALFSEGKKVLTGYTEQYTGTVKWVYPGTGLTNGTADSSITSTGTLNLKIASSGEIGGVKPGTTNGKTYGVQVNASTGEMTVNVPWSNDDTKNTAGSSNKTGTKLLLVGATSATTGETFTNSNVYINTSNQIIALSGTITSGNTALVTGGTVYTAIENAKEAATIYWETL